MSSTPLEVTRDSDDEVERLQRLIGKDLQIEPVRNSAITPTTAKLVVKYEDKDNARKDEIAVLGGQPGLKEQEETQADSDSKDEEQQISDPLKLPMGWESSDGKPIPYWLYKLHGLGQEFKCEICGNRSYWGSRAFKRHFKEWRHQYGMRYLGITDTMNFNEITSIQEAKVLWERIKEHQGGNKGLPGLKKSMKIKRATSKQALRACLDKLN